MTGPPSTSPAPRGLVTANLADSAAAPPTNNTTITGYGGTVTFIGVDVANLDAGGNGLTVNGTASDDTINVTPTGATAATIQANGAAPVLNLKTTATVSPLMIDALGGNNTLVVSGSANADSIVAATTDATHSTVTVNADLPVIYVTANLAALDIIGLDGNDQLTVDSTVSAVKPTVNYDGGAGVNALLLKSGGTAGNVAISDVYTPGPQAGSGSNSLNLTTGGAELINFVNLAPIFDFVAGPLTVNGTNAANQINYSEGFNSLANFLASPPVPSATWGQVSVDSYEPIEFINKTTLQINGLAGSDTISLNNPITAGPTGLTAITVDGGDPTAGSDTIIVNQTTPTNGAINYTPTAVDGGSITGAGPVPITLSHAEHLYLNDQGQGDTVTVIGTAGNGDTFVHTPGAVNDSGTVALNSLLALNYQNLSSAGTINIFETGPSATPNTLIVQGTGDNDAFGVAGGTGTVSLNSRVPITELGIQKLRLNGTSAYDTFTLNAVMPYVNVAVNGANIGDNDAVVLQGATGPITVNLGDVNATPPVPTTINGYNGAPLANFVSLSNIAQASINGAGAANLTVNGTPDDDVINYTPKLLGGAPAGGAFSLNGLNTVFNFNIGTGAVNTFTINGGGYTGGDQVNVYGPNSGSTFITDVAARTVTVSNSIGTSLKPVILGTGGVGDVNEIQLVNLVGGIGNNNFLVAPAPAAPALLAFQGASAQVGAAELQSAQRTVGQRAGRRQRLAKRAAHRDAYRRHAQRQPVRRGDAQHQHQRRHPHVRDSGGAEPIQWPDIGYSGVGNLQTNTFDPAGDATGTKQQTLVMGPDPYELNQTLATAAYLGNGATINVENLAIFPNSQEFQFAPGTPLLKADNDWYRVVAQSTGTLDFQVYFKQQFFIQNGNPADGALPGAGELSIDVYDANSNLIAHFGANDADSDQRRRIPVVAGESYYFRVYGQEPSGLGTNGYNMSILNTPAPKPDSLGLNNIVAARLDQQRDRARHHVVLGLRCGARRRPRSRCRRCQRSTTSTWASTWSSPPGLCRPATAHYRLRRARRHTFTFASGFSAAPAVGDTFQIESNDTGRRSSTTSLAIIRRRSTSGSTRPIRRPTACSICKAAVRPAATPPNNTPILIPFWAGSDAAAPYSPANNGSFRIAVYDNTNPVSPIFLGYADRVAGQTGVFQLQVTTPLGEGSHNIVAKVEIDSPANPVKQERQRRDDVPDRGRHAAPAGLFRFADDAQQRSARIERYGRARAAGHDHRPDHLRQHAHSYGVAEANAVVRLYSDTNNNGVVDNGDVLLGMTTATPIDGTNQFPSGQWQITSQVDLNDPSYGFSLDGVRHLLVTGEDAAGNVSAAQALSIFVDTQGPTVKNVSVTGSPGFNLFANKPDTPAPPRWSTVSTSPSTTSRSASDRISSTRPSTRSWPPRPATTS